ncbi:hypothetical protein MFLAVUS_001770 [Mucor flavus]|uniref:Uncharacterized protein n=1 Tax=Mucor flavus TaxID=439312 RepID=A0ABP9YNE1_9FUNG
MSSLKPVEGIDHELCLESTISNSSLRKDEEVNKKEIQETGTIGTFDFYIWTAIPAVGILFCLLHSEQHHFWRWEGTTTQETLSLHARIVVSVMSTVIGACVIATLMKTIISLSFMLVKYRGANFSQLTTMIGGYSPSYIPMLITGKACITIILIILILAVGMIAKQLAVVSMKLCLISTPDTIISYTRNYTTCDFTNYAVSKPQVNWDAFNSLMSPNNSFSNENYDRGIPDILKGYSKSGRVLPFSKASCKVVPEEKTFQSTIPTVSYNPSDNTSSSSITMTIAFDDDLYGKIGRKWMNCSIVVGYASALTTCNGTLCQTEQTSEITSYQNFTGAISSSLTQLFVSTFPNSTAMRHMLLLWLLGKDFSSSIEMNRPIEFEGIEITEDRTKTLATIIARILCDQNSGEAFKETTVFESNYQKDIHYSYVVSWRWPFWLLSVFILLLWSVCMASMWLAPECRIISVDWLLGQYVFKDKWCYLSGRPLVKTHKGLLFKVVDKYSDKDVGNVIILEAGIEEDARKDLVARRKQYQ